MTAFRDRHGATRLPRRRMLGLGVGLLGLACKPSWGQAQGVPREPDGFTSYVAGRMRVLAPDLPVKITGRLALEAGDSDAHDLYLDRLFDVCGRNPEDAVELVDRFVQGMAAEIRAPQNAATRDVLRVIVRPQSYLKMELDSLAGRAAPVAAPLVGDLWLLGACDLPTTIRMLVSSDLTQLGISQAEALAIGKQNLLSTMQKILAEGAKARQPGVSLLTGDPYESSLLAFPELWAPIARAGIGDLLVAVPASDVVLFSDSGAPNPVAGMGDLVQEVMAHDERPLVPTIFRWSTGGWSVAS